MLSLAHAHLGQAYTVAGFHPDLMQDQHLRNLGLVIGGPIRLISLENGSGIVTIQHTKVALGAEILNKILITEMEARPRCALSSLTVGQTAEVAAVLGSGAIKRRLLDMGITKGTPLLLRKVAPLGDPLEIRLRGYELTLRKGEADLVMVYQEDE